MTKTTKITRKENLKKKENFIKMSIWNGFQQLEPMCRSFDCFVGFFFGDEFFLLYNKFV